MAHTTGRIISGYLAIGSRALADSSKNSRNQPNRDRRSTRIDSVPCLFPHLFPSVSWFRNSSWMHTVVERSCYSDGASAGLRGYDVSSVITGGYNALPKSYWTRVWLISHSGFTSLADSGPNQPGPALATLVPRYTRSTRRPESRHRLGPPICT
jgi:hypothetical protein